MAFLAETLVDEWLNRQGYFTVRGLKDGVSEIDLLGVRPCPQGLEACHVELQASFRPVGYITPVSKEDRSAGFVMSKRVSKRRPDDVLQRGVSEWVEKKFTSRHKIKAKEQAWPGLSWRHIFVHAIIREPLEISLIASHNIEVVPFHFVLHQLKHVPTSQSGGAGTEISEIMEYFANRGVGSVEYRQLYETQLARYSKN